ncbi:Serine/threonine-protein kinase PknK [compost metagenome]
MLQHAWRLKAAGAATAWFNVDAADNDLGRFVSHLNVAVAGVAPATDASLHDGGVLELIERIAASTTAFTLFLDDFEAIQSSAVLDLIRQVVEHMPQGWQLVIGSRIVPGLGLGRLRARGQVFEIGLEQLRFSPEETAEFMRERRGLPLSGALLERLHHVTEGWATALWLASVSLEGREQPEAFLESFSGSDAAITEFLAEDVLDKQSELVRGFLLRTSILQELNASLCDAVTGRQDSAAMLAHLEQSNLFVVSLDRPGHYRYHSLFADFLRVQLQHASPGAAAGLHRRAAQWFEAQARPVPAIEHAMQADDPEILARVLGNHVQKLLDVGRFRLLARWLDKLPAAVLDANPRLRMAHLWALAFTHRHQEALAMLARFDALQANGGVHCDDEVQAHLLAMRPMFMMMSDDQQGLAVAIESHARLDPHYGFPYSLLTNSLAFFYAGLNRNEEARALLERARRSHFEIGSTFSLVIAECLEGTISLRQGRLQDALVRFRVAMNNMATEETPGAEGHALAAVQLAEALYEAGQSEQAERILTVYLPLARDLGLGDFLVRGHITLSRLAWHRGEHERAFGLLGELEYQGHQDNARRLVVCSELERSRLALLRGDTAAAAAYLRRGEESMERLTGQDPAVPLHDVESIALARLRLKVRGAQPASALDEALAELPEAIETARAQECHRLRLHLTLLWVEALQRTGNVVEAGERLARAIAEAAPQGMVQPFADEGPVVAAMVLAWRRANAARVRQQSAEMAAFAERLEAACQAAAGTASDDDAAVRSDAEALATGLTHREIHVLKLLALGKSNAAIAQSLFVSENTIRTHLRNISAKLGAHNRTEAVMLARQLGLVA